MDVILNIETSTTLCSVCLADKGEVIAFKELNAGYTHAENLHVFIQEVLKEAGLKALQLRAVAVGEGPGSYTGLRIGVSAAKGIAFASGIPLIGINTLKTMAISANEKIKEGALICPMLDARRMEVYCAVYDKQLNEVKATSAQIIESGKTKMFDLGKPIYFCGDGMPKCKEVLKEVPGAFFLEDIVPSSAYLARLSYESYKAGQFEDVAYFEPFYLKDFLIKKPS